MLFSQKILKLVVFVSLSHLWQHLSFLLKKRWPASTGLKLLLLQTQALRTGQVEESCIGLTQENSIEFLVQSSLPYILLLMVHAYYCAPYPNDHMYNMRLTCVVYAV